MATTSNPVGSPIIRDLTPKPRESNHPEAKKFEDLAAKVVQVPKHEIDEQRKDR